MAKKTVTSEYSLSYSEDGNGIFASFFDQNSWQSRIGDFKTNVFNHCSSTAKPTVAEYSLYSVQGASATLVDSAFTLEGILAVVVKEVPYVKFATPMEEQIFLGTMSCNAQGTPSQGSIPSASSKGVSSSKVFREIDSFLQTMTLSSISGCFPIVGPSGSGKTSLMIDISRNASSTYISLFEPDAYSTRDRILKQHIQSRFVAAAPTGVEDVKYSSIVSEIDDEIKLLASSSAQSGGSRPLLVIDSISSLLYLSMPGFSLGKSGLSNGIFPLLTMLSNAAVHYGITIIPVINPLALGELNLEAIEGSSSGIIFPTGDKWSVRGRALVPTLASSRSENVSFEDFFFGKRAPANPVPVQSVKMPSFTFPQFNLG